MIAKIKTDNGIYDSIVFAILHNSWESKFVVFNQDFTHLQTINEFDRKNGYIVRNAFIYNSEKAVDWIDSKNTEGYKWVLNALDDNFNMQQLFDNGFIEKCKALQSAVKDCVWLDLKTETDIDGLMEAAFGFHDSYIKDMYTQSGKQYILFDTTWGCEILLELDGNAETNLFKGLGNTPVGDDLYPLILSSSMFFENGLTYWIDGGAKKSAVGLDKSQWYFFCASNVKWQLIISSATI